MRYFRAQEQRETQEAAFRLYIGTGVQYMVEYIAGLCGGGKALMPYADFMQFKPADTRSGDEIAADIIKRAGLKVRT